MLEQGYKVPSTTLTVKGYVSKKRVACKCSACENRGAKKATSLFSYTFDESEILSGKAKCRLCKQMGDTVDKSISDWAELCNRESNWNMLPVGRDVAVTSNDISEVNELFNKYPIGTVINDGIVRGAVTIVTGRNNYGVKVGKAHTLAIKCQRCGGVSYTNEPDVYCCPICTNRYISAQKELQEIANREREKKSGKVMPHITTRLERMKEDSNLSSDIAQLESKNEGFKVIDVGQSGSTSYTCTCKDCGSIVVASRKNAKIKCDFCENRKPWELGIMQQSHLGEVHNGLVIIAQDGFECSVRCTFCERESRGIPLFDVLRGRYFCDCSSSNDIAGFLSLCCAECGLPLKSSDIKLAYKDVLQGKDIICKECGHNNKEDVTLDLDTFDYGRTLREKIKLANTSLGKGVKIGGFDKNMNKNLLVEKEPLYKGVDGQLYSRCLCKVHNKSLVLSESEIYNYNCEQCFDARQRVVGNIDVDNLKV